METQNLVISFDYSWFLAKNLAYAECPIMKFHYRNSSNTQETSHFYWHQFWDKNDDKNLCHWNYFQIPRALSELPAIWPGQFSQKIKNFCAIPWHQKLIVYVEESLKSSCLFFKNMHSMQWPHKEGLPKVNALEIDGQAEYRLFFLRSISQSFTQIHMNCFVSS